MPHQSPTLPSRSYRGCHAARAGNPQAPGKLARDERSRARATPVEVEILKVHLSKGNRALGMALVDVRIGPVVATYGYQRLRKNGRWQVTLPVDGDGKEALRLPKGIDGRVVEMVRDAAEADEKVCAGLRQRW